MIAPAPYVPPVRTLATALLAVRMAHARIPDAGGPPVPGPEGLLFRHPDVVPHVEARWLRGEPLDPERIAVETGMGPVLAHALVAAVDLMDPDGPEVEAVRIDAWLRSRAAAPTASRPGFPGRAGPSPSGATAAEAHGNPPVPIAHPEVPGGAAPDPDAGTAMSGDEAVARVVARQPGPLPETDMTWFGRRPGRSHRIRPALATEVGGGDPSGWVTLVMRDAALGNARLCAIEAGLPRTDRGEADLRRTFRALASLAATRPAAGTGDAAGALPSPPSNRAESRKDPPVRRVPPRPRPVPAAQREPYRMPLPREYRGIDDRAGAAAPPPAAESSATDLGAIAGRLAARHGTRPLRAHDVLALCGPGGRATLDALKAAGLVTGAPGGLLRVAAGASTGA